MVHGCGRQVELVAPGTLRTAPPTEGQHNEEILTELGYSKEAIDELQNAGVVGSENQRLTADTSDAPAGNGPC